MTIPGGDLKIFAMAFVFGGLLPSLLWLWFWLKEDEDHPEPKAMLALVFILGIAVVILVLPIQQFIANMVQDAESRLVLWAAAEEALKYLAVLAIISSSRAAKDPIDWPIYLITAALGFATLENALFLVKPFALSETTVGLLTGHLRYLGATLLHTVASGIIGISMGISFHLPRFKRAGFVFVGFLAAVALHSAFNFFIIRNGGADFLKVFSFLWVTTVILLLLFEKVRRMSK
ncbi:MAG: PrsW family intramembrane metalloprotease [bacterium]|nr:PrsW family intramembrane metalloprotease [bacterium]